MIIMKAHTSSIFYNSSIFIINVNIKYIRYIVFKNYIRITI